MLPAARVVDARPPPNACRAIEIEEQARPAARAVFHHKMPVEINGLYPRQQRVLPVQVPPARLNHAHFRIRKMRDNALQKLGRRQKIRVKNRDELAPRNPQSLGQRARLVPGAYVAMDQRDS